MLCKRYYKLFMLIIAICFLYSCGRLYAAPYSSLAAKISNIINNDSILSAGKVSIKVKALNGPVIYSKNEVLMLVPASNMKVITSVVALDRLGEKYRYKTALYGGPINLFNGALYGPLILSGTGDPTWMYGFFDNPTEVLEVMADYLKFLGVKTIQGDVVADDLAFDRHFIPEGWKNEQECYTSPVSALALNSNQVSVRVWNGKVFVYPSTCAIKVVKNNFKNSSGDMFINRDSVSDTIFINGYAGYDYTRILPVYNPSLFTVSVFKEILEKKGIKVTGEARTACELESFCKNGMYKWYENKSCYLIDIMKQMNKESDNFLAEQLFKTISASQVGIGTFEDSKKIIFDFCERAGINIKGVEICDGSGLSLKDRISAEMLTSFLEYIYNSDFGPDFMNTLACAGIDGTLKYRLNGVPLYAKTGTLDGYSSLSGYVKTKAGQWIVFAIILNNGSCSTGYLKEVENNIVTAIAQYGGKIDVEKTNEVIIN